MVSLPFNETYCATKFAVEAFMKNLASLVRHFGIYISLIAPGAVNTEFLATGSAQYPAPHSDAADPYGALLSVCLENLKRRVMAGQTGAEVGQVILDVARADTPHLRYRTSDFARTVAAQIRVDPTGDSSLMHLRAQLKA